MKLAQIEESIRKLCFRTDAQAEERILGDALSVLEGAHVSALGRGLSVLRMIRESLPVRLAGAAVLIAAVLGGGQYLAGRLEGCSDTTALTIELASNDISRFFGI